MLIRIMKQEALDALKANLNSTYLNYYSYSNKWIYDLCNGDPFVDFKEVPDFELDELDFNNIGKTDFNNCKILQNNLSLTPSQACDERLWAGLCHDVFYNYVRKRWKMINLTKDISQEKAVGLIKSRFFFSGGQRAGLYRNTLSKCWWVGKLTKGPLNDYELLNKLGHSDFSTKVSDIFRNYNFISNPEILTGIIEGIAHFNDEGIKLGVATHIRPVLQYINAVGGGTLLDYWTSDEIKELFIEHENKLLNGFETIENSDISYEDEDIETNNENVSSDNTDEIRVSLASKVTYRDNSSNEEKQAYVFYNNKITPIGHVILQMKKGDIFEYDGSKFTIIDIQN